MAVGALQDAATAVRVGTVGKYSIVFKVYIVLFFEENVFLETLFLPPFSYTVVIILMLFWYIFFVGNVFNWK